MDKKIYGLLAAAMVSFAYPHCAEAQSKFKALAKSAQEASADSTQGKDSYEKVLKDYVGTDGMFRTLRNKEGKLLFELSADAFKHQYLLSNRVAQVSNTHDYNAGQIIGTPMLVSFTCDSLNVYLHLEQSDAMLADGDPIKPAFDRSFINPIIKGFKIMTRKDDKLVIDVTSFFGENERCLSPMKPDNPLAKLLSSKTNLKGSFNSSASAIKEVKTFPTNIEIKTSLSYTLSTTDEPYTVLVHRSLLQLPDEPMMMRRQDNRVGFFNTYKSLYSSSKDKVETFNIINRWRLEPKPEDRERYFRGEKVEPQKKIVFYVDNAFPEKWRGAVKEGIEYWNVAFEAAGFKNAIEARDYPVDDPTFDPDDARYSCVKYCASPTANAMGPSHIDPRTGEILVAEVLWYHNILSLVHDWKFVQTGAVDPRVRKNVFDDDVMYESLTYVAAHEIGHTLGLMHNMGASYAFTLEQLRDPEFTQKHGTTPSIMDYARNNFVAQPGDKERGVKLTPPNIGVYDIHAIHWGYTLIEGAKTMDDEAATLDSWIREKDGDPMYEFGAQQLLGMVDPTDQTEDLSNDHITASDMSFSNLKIIMQHLEEWTVTPGDNYDNVVEKYKAVVKQYSRHIGHVMPYIGGIKHKEVRQGHDDGNYRTYVSKAETKRAMNWLLQQVRTNDWMVKPSIMDKAEEYDGWREKLERNVVACLFNIRNLQGIKDGYKADPAANYNLYDYLQDAYNLVFSATIRNKALDDTERNMQAQAVRIFTTGSGLAPKAASSSSSSSSSSSLTMDDVCSEYYSYLAGLESCEMPCYEDHSTDFVRVVMGLPTLPATECAPIMTSYLKKVLALYRAHRATTSDRATQMFYDYQILSIEKLFKN